MRPLTSPGPGTKPALNGRSRRFPAAVAAPTGSRARRDVAPSMPGAAAQPARTFPDARPAVAIDPPIADQPRARRAPHAELPQRKLVVALCLVSAFSAVAGGIDLILWRDGSHYVPSIRLLAHTPFASFLVPGLILAIVVGGTSLACAILASRRAVAAVDAAILAGGTLTVWIVAQIAIIRAVDWLHWIYGGLGLAILWLGLRAAWRSRLPRHRWVIAVTLAETAGYLVPASAGILSARAGIGGLAQAALVVVAGLFEGLALGAAQAWAFPLPVRRLRYALFTALGAGVAWLSVMSAAALARTGAVPPALVAVAALGAGLVGLAAIGSAQWLELRRHAAMAHRWIAWTGLAWVIALPLSFAPGPFVDGSTPLASHLALWGSGGLLMACAMALITWQGARRLSAAVGVVS